MKKPVVGKIALAAGSNPLAQGIGVTTGLQDKFSWKGALAALGGAVGGALGPGGAFGRAGMFGNVGSKFAEGALRGLASSALTQGIGVATGLQKKFDWAGVAAAGIGGGLASAMSHRLNASITHAFAISPPAAPRASGDSLLCDAVRQSARADIFRRRRLRGLSRPAG